MKNATRPKTPNRGAADIIARVIAHVNTVSCNRLVFYEPNQRVQSGYIDDQGSINRENLITWLRDWDKRAAAKPGGLGRAKKAKGGR